MTLYAPWWVCLLIAGLATIGLADGAMGCGRIARRAWNEFKFRRLMRRLNARRERGVA